MVNYRLDARNLGTATPSMRWNYAKNGGDSTKVPLVSGKSGQVKPVSVGASEMPLSALWRAS